MAANDVLCLSPVPYHPPLVLPVGTGQPCIFHNHASPSKGKGKTEPVGSDTNRHRHDGGVCTPLHHAPPQTDATTRLVSLMGGTVGWVDQGAHRQQTSAPAARPKAVQLSCSTACTLMRSRMYSTSRRRKEQKCSARRMLPGTCTPCSSAPLETRRRPKIDLTLQSLALLCLLHMHGFLKALPQSFVVRRVHLRCDAAQAHVGHAWDTRREIGR